MSRAGQVFDCAGCGECCRGAGGILLRERDASRLAAHLAMSEDEFRLRFAESVRGATRLGVDNDGWCVFHRGGGCSVHAAKPDVCRAWPFFRGNLVDPVSLEMARGGCPGIRPDCSHAQFAAAGSEYLLANGLGLDEDEAGPRALVPESVLRGFLRGKTLEGKNG